MPGCSVFDEITAKYPRFVVGFAMDGDPPRSLEISLLDSLDTDTSSGFTQGVEELLRKYPSLRRLSIDASKVRYLSSTGLGSIASIYLLAQKQGVAFSLRNPSAHVNMLLKLLGFEQFIPVVRGGTAE